MLEKNIPHLMKHTDMQICDIGAERTVLAMMLLDPDEIMIRSRESLGCRLGSWLFNDEKHVQIYNAILYLRGHEKDITGDNIVKYLLRRDNLDAAGGIPYIGDFMSAVSTSAHFEIYAGIVRNYARLRQLIHELKENANL